MRKTGKKFLLILAALVLVLAMFAGCGSTYHFEPLDGYDATSGAAVESNGGFVAKKGGWIYFINGVESNTSSNNYGSVTKGSLVRISESALAEGNYSSAEIVIPEIVYDGNYDAGIFIEGDYVYYATPNNTRNMQAQIENTWLNFKRARLDGSDVLSGNYAQLEIGSHAYRYVVENDTVYLLYADTANSEIHSVNTKTMQDVTLVEGYASYAFDSENVANPTVYYTMPVAKKNTYSGGSASNENYQQFYTVSAATTTAPREYDLSDGYTDPDLKPGDEDYQMEYVNLGTLVLDGVGRENGATPFNIDLTEDNIPKQLGGYTYAIERFAGGDLYFTATTVGDSNTVSSVCRLSGEAYASAVSADTWDTIQANPNRTEQGVESAGGAITLVSYDTEKATENALYYVENDTQYFIYIDSTSNNIYRTRAVVAEGSGFTEKDEALAYAQEGAALLFMDTETHFLYYSRTGTNGNALWRVRYDGEANYYNGGSDMMDIENAEDYKATQYLGVDYNSSWFAPEVVNGRIFFADADTYADNYVYVIDACATNEDLKARNDNYQAVQDLFTEVEEKFSAAANVMRYYYYGGDVSIVTDDNGEYRDEYEDQDIELINAFVAGTDQRGYGFAEVKEFNRRTSFVNCISIVTDGDKSDVEDSLKTAYITGFTADTEDNGGWTWQWAALFVPIGVVLIGGGIAAWLIVRRRRRR